MACTKIPLVPVPVQVLACNFFKCKAKLVCFCGFKLVCTEVQVQAPEKGRVANKVPEHMKNASTLIVRHCVKHIFLIVVLKTNKVFFCTIACQVALHI